MIRKILIFIAIIAIAIALLVYIVKSVLIPFFKLLFNFLKWLFKTLPILIIIALFVPGLIDEGVYLIIILFLAIVDTIKLGDTGYYGDHYILNKKSKIAHKASDSSADTIGYNHREDVYATESELKSRGYRIKKDS